MDQNGILKCWAAENFNSNSNCESESKFNFHLENQESESSENPDPNPDEENEDRVGIFLRTVQEAKMNLLQSLREKRTNEAESSETEILTLKRRLNESEFKNYELREEKRRAELSLELKQVSTSILEWKLEEMTREKNEVELKLDEITRENSTLQFLLNEKEKEIQKLSHSVSLGNQQHNLSAVEPFSSPCSVSEETLNFAEESREEIQKSPSVSIETEKIHNSVQMKIESVNLMEISKEKHIQNGNENLLAKEQNAQEKSPHHPEEQIKSHSKSRTKSPRVEREKVKPPKKADSKFEKSNSSHLKRERTIPKPSPSTTFENEETEKNEPLRKRRKIFSRASTSNSASSKPSRDETRQKQVQKSPSVSIEPEKIHNSTRIKIKPVSLMELSIPIPEICIINRGSTNHWEMENCPHARDFWYDSNRSTVPKFLIRFYNDQEYQRDKLLHVKQQKKLEEPKIKYVELKHVEKTFEGLSKQLGSGFRLWLDVRDFNIFSTKFSGFFKEFGKFVTHFSFGRRLFSADEIEASQLLNFIFEHFPNLEYLAVDEGMLNKMDQPLKNIREKKLEKLKTIRLTTTRQRIATSLIIQLLLHAPALEKFYGIPLHCLSEIKSYFERAGSSNLPPWCKKQKDGANEISMDFVKELTVIRNIYDEASSSFSFHANPKTFFNKISNLCHLKPPLQVIDVRTYFVRDPEIREMCTKKWSQLLNSIKIHVKILKIEPYQMPSFPRLENLGTLQFDLDICPSANKLLFGYFPPGFDLNHKFPNLKIVQIGLGERSSQILKREENKSDDLFRTHFPRDVFRRCGTFSRVERLNLFNFAPSACFLNLKALFPRITILQLTLETVEMSNALPMVYKFWPGLKQLILNVSFSSHLSYNLDSAFTGIPDSQCKLFERQIRVKDLSLGLDAKSVAETIRKYRNKSSIQDFKNLSLLKIELNVRKREGDNRASDCLMTPVSGIYGFGSDQMPNLKVVVGFDERMTTADRKFAEKLLKPMESYLTIDR